MNLSPIAIKVECEACHAVEEYACDLQKVLMADGEFYQDVMACQDCAARCPYCKRWALKGDMYEFGNSAIFKWERPRPELVCRVCYAGLLSDSQFGYPGKVQEFRFIPGRGYVVEHQYPEAHWFAPWTEFVEFLHRPEHPAQGGRVGYSSSTTDAPMYSLPTTGGLPARVSADGCTEGCCTSALAVTDSPCGDTADTTSAGSLNETNADSSKTPHFFEVRR